MVCLCVLCDNCGQYLLNLKKSAFLIIPTVGSLVIKNFKIKIGRLSNFFFREHQTCNKKLFNSLYMV